MEVRHPNELTLLVVAPQCAENDLVPVEARMATSPLVDARRRLDVARGRPPLLVPPLGIAGDQVGRELIHEHERREPCKKRDSVVERFHMMEHARCYDRVPTLRCQHIRNLLELASQIAVAVRCSRVHADDVVAAAREVFNEPSLLAAPHLEHACRRGR